MPINVYATLHAQGVEALCVGCGPGDQAALKEQWTPLQSMYAVARRTLEVETVIGPVGSSAKMVQMANVQRYHADTTHTARCRGNVLMVFPQQGVTEGHVRRQVVGGANVMYILVTMPGGEWSDGAERYDTRRNPSWWQEANLHHVVIWRTGVFPWQHKREGAAGRRSRKMGMALLRAEDNIQLTAVQARQWHTWTRTYSLSCTGHSVWTEQRVEVGQTDTETPIWNMLQ